MRRIWKFFKTFLKIFFGLILLWSIFNYSLVIYGFGQLTGQMRIIRESKPVEEVLKDPSLADSLKQRLLFIDSVKRFAIDTLGLKASENYTTFYDQHNKPILWTITACEPYSLKAYQWKFPLLGSVSYKGFFDYEKGLEEANELKSEGFDVDYDEVSAWSTLGWFKDPILSSMLRRSKGRIAELIIHEMTHATLYVKSSVDFNENLASVCGEQGAIQFLKSIYGEGSPELNEYIFYKEDYDRFSKHMLLGTTKLDSVYASVKDSLSLIKLKAKTQMIIQIVSSIDTIVFHRPDKFKNLFRKELPNNAYLINFIRYDSQKDEMKKEMDLYYRGNIKAYLEHLKLSYNQ